MIKLSQMPGQPVLTILSAMHYILENISQYVLKEDNMTCLHLVPVSFPVIFYLPITDNCGHFSITEFSLKT